MKDSGFTKESALELLQHDVIKDNIYDLFDAVGVNTSSDNPKPVYIRGGGVINDRKDKLLTEFGSWLGKYKELNHPDRLSVSDIAITSLPNKAIHGIVMVVNGMNGQTQVSRQSLKHVVDIIGHLEDYYGARAYISYVSTHSDVYYYAITFVIWKDNIEAIDNHEWGNLKPLYHE